MEKVYKYKGIFFKRIRKREYNIATRFQTWNCSFMVQGVNTIKNAKEYINCILKRESTDLAYFKKVSEKYIKGEYSYDTKVGL